MRYIYRSRFALHGCLALFVLLAFLTGRTIFVEWKQNGHFKSKATKSKTQQPSLACQPSLPD